MGTGLGRQLYRSLTMEVTMCFRLFAGMVTATTLLFPAYGIAAGTNMHELANAHEAVQTSVASTPQGFANEPTWGCGSHRYYDPETRKCRGPGDF
jgi:hypothetical protein